MDIPAKDAQVRLDEILDRVDAGEEVVLTRDGRPSVRLLADPAVPRPRFDIRVIDEITSRAVREALPGPDAAHSQDFLYDEYGLPN